MMISHFNEIRNDLLSFHLLTGFRVAIYGLDEKEIYGFPPGICSLCRIVKRNPEARSHCDLCDHNAFLEASKTGKSYLYCCPFGLFEAVVPLFIDNTLSGYLMIGQVAEKSEMTAQQIRKLLSPFVSDESVIQEGVTLLHQMSSEQIHASVAMIEICASHIIDKGWLKRDIDTLPLKVKQYIDQRYTEKIDINTICEDMCYSRSYIIKSFKEEFGCNINKYIETKRLAHAADLLRTTNDSIASISERCGYNDQYYFSKVFKKNFGYSPSESKNMCHQPDGRRCW